MFKSLVTLVLAAVGALIVLLALNTVASRQRRFTWEFTTTRAAEQISTTPQLDRERVQLRAQRLAKSLTFQTISWERNQVESEAFLNLHHHLRKSFPLVHSSPFVELTVVNDYSLLYRVRGNKEDDSVLPFMLTAHLDVVPVANGSWKLANPFDGSIIDDVVYGRGALDDKSSVMGILEALEFLIENNHVFQRTFYIGFGHDEELTGFNGAGHIAKHLQANGVSKLDFILDEGYFVLEDFIDGVDQLVSVIGVTEKGYATLELVVDMNPGHSSIPPRETAIGVLSKAVAALEANAQPSLFGQGPELDFFSYMAPHAKIGHSLIFSNLWIFSTLMSKILGMNPVTDAIQRTTTSITILKAGYKSNVIPGTASATINHRIHPVSSLDEVLEHDRQVINDPRVDIKVLEYYPPTPVSPYGEHIPAFHLIASCVKQIYPSSVIAPACSPANTDLRRYVELSDHLYRINPTIITPVTRDGIHGDDERISVEHYNNFIQFYVTLMVNADRAGKMPHSSSRHYRDL